MEKTTYAQTPERSVLSIKQVLQILHANRFPHVANPANCKKRASVALVIRFRPHHGHVSRFELPKYADSVSFDQCLESLFDQEWVRHGTAEALFIQRAARAGDRWGGHVALPGGMREASDADDCAVSIRETKEETGLSLEEHYCLRIGNLPERLVTAAWGKRPYVFMTRYYFLY